MYKDGDGDRERCTKNSVSWRILIQMLVSGLFPEKQNFKDEFSELLLWFLEQTLSRHEV